MKNFSLIGLLVALVLTGCGKEEAPPAPKASPSSGGSALTAPVDYLNAATKAEIKAQKDVDVVGVNKAIDMFASQEGRNPKDLAELVAKGYLRAIPKTPFGTKLEYDASTGTVKVVKQ